MCSFLDLGGAGLHLSGRVKNCTISLNEFSRIGDSAVLSAGRVSLKSAEDGSFDSVPSGNIFTRNHIHRIGMYAALRRDNIHLSPEKYSRAVCVTVGTRKATTCELRSFVFA
jgi:hypothetical protein